MNHKENENNRHMYYYGTHQLPYVDGLHNMMILKHHMLIL